MGWRSGCVWVGVAALLAAPAAADTFTYDLLGRVRTQLSADGKLTTYSYDAAGNRTSVVTTASAANRPPVAVNDAAGLNEGVASLTFDPRVNDSDPDGNPITIVSNSLAQFGTLTRTTTTLTYTPNAGTRRFSAQDSFTYTIQDSVGARASAVVTIDLINLPPIAATDTISVARNLGGAAPYVFDPRANDSDPGGDAFTIMAVSAPAHGTSFRTPTSVGYTPTALYTGPDSFTYTIQDTEGATAVGTINVNVFAPANTGPTANDDYFTIDPPLTAPQEWDPRVGDTDPDGDPLLITAVTQGSIGTVQILYGGQAVRYTATTVGSSDSFTYTISDGQGHTATATVHVTFNVG